MSEEVHQTTPLPQVQLPTRRAGSVLPNSQRGDLVWRTCQPVLEWLIEHGDDYLRGEAIKTRAYWEQHQGWLIELLNNNHYFTMVERATADLRGYEQALRTIPPCTGMQMDYWTDDREEPYRVDVIAYLALVAAKRQRKGYSRRQGD